jgi:hypothetical protein
LSPIIDGSGPDIIYLIASYTKLLINYAYMNLLSHEYFVEALLCWRRLSHLTGDAPLPRAHGHRGQNHVLQLDVAYAWSRLLWLKGAFAVAVRVFCPSDRRSTQRLAFLSPTVEGFDIHAFQTPFNVLSLEVLDCLRSEN